MTTTADKVNHLDYRKTTILQRKLAITTSYTKLLTNVHFIRQYFSILNCTRNTQETYLLDTSCYFAIIYIAALYNNNQSQVKNKTNVSIFAIVNHTN